VKRATSFTLDDEVLTQARQIASVLGRSVSWVMSRAIENGMPIVQSQAGKMASAENVSEEVPS